MNKYLILLLLICLTACNGKKASDVQTTLVKKGVFSAELTEEGTVKATNSIAITTPAISYRYGGLKITSLIEDGKEVQQGDTVMVFDPSEIKKAIINSEQQLEIAKAELDKLVATQQSEIDDLEADLEITRISQEISKINFEQAVFESEVTKKEINLKLETANISLARAKEQIENKKKIHQQEQIQKKLAIKQLSVTLEDANKFVNSLYVISPARGIAIIKENWMTNQKWQVGDQPYSGTTIIDLPDLSEMLAEVKINEVDVSKVVPGLKVMIKADAYSDTTYVGHIVTVANLAQNKDTKTKIKIFPIQIKIDGTNPKLLPGLTVSCKILVNEIKDVIYIPVEAIFKADGVEFVYVKSGSGFKRRDIKIGSTNTDFVIITEGLSEKDEIALTDPFLNKEEDAGTKTGKKTNGNKN
ncbi:MAG: HlyD family efflux transporter periplasmic adaptor subunit [Bacteroidales bacterium]|nr:HlyD family efflux transporter periplasmic adaptor subunit [Bacteroidales bacterium]